MALGRPVIYPLCLAVGALLVVVAAALHPNLAGDGAAQLRTIAACRAWRVIHWTLLFAFPLSLTGLAGLAGRHAGTGGELAGRAGLVVSTLAYGAWAVIVAFMLGAGWALARGFVTADAGLTATEAVFVFDMLHPFGLAAQRLAGFALGLSTYLFGWCVIRGKALPRWLGACGVAGGGASLAVALATSEASKAQYLAFALPVLWQATAAVALLRNKA